MGSTQIKLAKVLEELQYIKQCTKEQKMNEYTRGMFNGLELAWALLNNKKPEYIERKK